MRAINVLRHPVSSYIVGVLLPSGIVVLPFFYDEHLGQIGAYLGAIYLALLSSVFIGHVRRVVRLKTTYSTMPSYAGSYVLLLRSFGRTEGYRSTARDPGPDGLVAGPMEESEIGDLEAAMRARGVRLVALGGEFLLPANHGLFWLTTRDDDWEDNFHLLARDAAAILICPETTEGIRREIAFLKDRGFLKKSVFFMAPSPKARNWFVSGFIQYEEPEARAQRWKRHREEYRVEGIELPEYDERGLFFTLDDDLQVGGTAPVRTDSDIFSLIPSDREQSARFSDVFPKLKLDRPIYHEVNWLYPPGADQSLPRGSMFFAMWGLIFNAFVIAPKLFIHLGVFAFWAFWLWVVVLCLKAVIRWFGQH